jgi:NitT/TauT family transport system substrate-binding protein
MGAPSHSCLSASVFLGIAAMKKRQQIYLQLLLMMLCILPLPISQAQRLPGTNINVAIPASFNIAPLLLAHNKGIFRKHNLAVTIHIVNDEIALLNGVKTNQYDIGYANVISFLQAIDRNEPFLLAHPAYSYAQSPKEDTQQLYIHANSKIKQLSDLTNATIGTPYMHNIAEWHLRKMLDNAGISDHRNLRWTYVAADMAHRAVLDGKVDGVWLKQPEGTKAQAAGLVAAFPGKSTPLPGATGGYYFTSKTFSTKHWNLMRQFQTAMRDAHYYAFQYPSQNREALLAHVPLDRSLLSQIPLNRHTNTSGIQSLNIIAADAVRYGLIKQAPQTATLFWTRPVYD